MTDEFLDFTPVIPFDKGDLFDIIYEAHKKSKVKRGPGKGVTVYRRVKIRKTFEVLL